MMKRIVVSCLVLGLLCGVWAVAAAADDLLPPPWRGHPGTTSQVWEFMENTPGIGIPPDGPAPGGLPPLPSTHVVVHPVSDWMPYDPLMPQRQGIWPLSGWMDVVVDNSNVPNPLKWMWVQLTWQSKPAGPVPELYGFDPLGTPPQIVGQMNFPNDWHMTTYQWFISPNPPDERFTIGGLINVDELVIDTWCVPEPASLALLAIGGLALVCWRRR